MKAIIISKKEFQELIDKLNEIEKVVSEKEKGSLNEKWLDNEDVCEILKISKRALQNYRGKGMLPFSQIGNKIYYKASDIEKHLENNYIHNKF